MKKFFIGCVWSCIVLGALSVWGVTVAINSASVWETALPPLFESVLHDTFLPELSIRDVSLDLQGACSLDYFSARFEVPDDEVRVSFDSFECSSLYPLIGVGEKDTVDVVLREGAYSQEGIDCTGLDVDARVALVDTRLKSCIGSIAVGTVAVNEVVARDISAEFECFPDEVRITNIEAAMYDGSIVGSVTVLPQEKGSFTLTLNIAGLDLTQLARERPDQFSHVHGIANGSLAVQGNQDGLSRLSADISLLPNARVRAGLLAPLVGYIPQNSFQRQELEQLIRDDAMVVLDKGNILLLNSDEQTLTAQVTVESVRFNLNINLTVDFTVEGGLTNVFKLGNVVLKPKQ